MNTQETNHIAGHDNDHPALYVGTYGKYNGGSTKGGWVDIVSFQNGEDFIKFCTNELHSDESDPELMFQDFENFPEYLYGETMTAKGIDEIMQWYKEENEERVGNALANVQIVDYNAGVSIAVVGDTYPIRKELKNMGGIFRKHNEHGPCWVFSLKRRKEVENFINSGKAETTGKTPKEVKADAPDKALLEEYLNEERKVWPKDERMIEYYRKEASRVIRLTNGGLLVFDKPKIETNFCFGYGCQSMTYEEASKAADNAASEKYFMSENLNELDRNIKAMAGNLEDDWHYSSLKPYLYKKSYNNQTINICNYQWMNPWEVEHEPWRTKGYAEFAPLSDDDRKLILEALKAERAAFEKRLKNWWKRYGVKKLHIWTYWADE